MHDSIPHIIEMLRTAGQQIMDVYAMGAQGAEVEWKQDSSPLTLADRRSHDYICSHLTLFNHAIPIMSEESAQLPFEERREWSRYWCLDPLDGTKEFIKRNDQFTINLALIEEEAPTIGFIHIPVSGHTYWAMKGRGAFLDDGISSTPIQANKKSIGWVAIGSNSHADPHDEEILHQF
ncbi:MAG: 3'(2'),5'-bisphosphate nucleotidase CysQ, partial [Flavobacteriales bacterium]